MSLRAKVHMACVVVIVVCEVQTACVKYFADLVDASEKRHV